MLLLLLCVQILTAGFRLFYDVAPSAVCSPFNLTFPIVDLVFQPDTTISATTFLVWATHVCQVCGGDVHGFNRAWRDSIEWAETRAS